MLDDILRQIDYLAVLAPLNPKPKGSREIWVTCPKCKHNEAFIYRDGRSIMCRRGNKCGETTSLLEYVHGIRQPRGEDFIKACEQLAKIGGAQFERRRMSESQKLEMQKQEVRADALSLLKDCASANLKNQWGDFTGGAAVDYLQSRNFDVIKALDYGFGCIENVKDLQDFMTLEQLTELGFYFPDKGFFTDKWDKRILIPLCDYRGKLRGFAGRTYANHERKYMNTEGTRLSELVAVELEPALKHGGTVIGVEGFLDPFKARMNGIPGVVAVGTTGKALSAERWEELYRMGVRQFVFITDNDKAGRDGLMAALANVDKAKNSPEVFTMIVPDAKDLDEWIDNQLASGRIPSGEFGQLYRARTHSDRLRAQVFATGLDMSSEGDRWTLVQKAMDYDATIGNPRRLASLVHHFWPEIQELTDISVEVISDICNNIRASRVREEKRKAVENALSFAKQELGSKSPDVALADLQSQLVTIEQSMGFHAPSKALSPQELLSSDVLYLEDVASREFLGIPQFVFPKLDEMLSGLRGLTVFAGGTNIGKTVAFGLMALGVIQGNKDVCVLFASLEMPPRTLRIRLLSYLTGMGIQEVAKAVKRGEPIVMEALAEMERDIMPRLRIINQYEPAGTKFTVNSMCQEADDLKKITGCDRCVIIVDYMGVWPVDENKYRTDSQVQKQQVADMLAIRDYNANGAMIAAMELTKEKEDSTDTERGITGVMGSARAIYSADNVVIQYRFSDRMLLEHFTINMDHLFGLKKPVKIMPAEMKKQNIQEKLDSIKEALERRSMTPMQWKVDKVRDGGKKGKINLMMHWITNKALEGLEV